MVQTKSLITIYFIWINSDLSSRNPWDLYSLVMAVMRHASRLGLDIYVNITQKIASAIYEFTCTKCR